MKIKKVILKNFSAIENAMNAHELTIDFPETDNKICLIIGPNGSGKTTIMSLLNPFAELGSLDVRNALNLILPNKDGYKELHIQSDDNIYIIKHFYTHHKDANHSVKSYITKNDEELNPNGNVRSFKEIIKEELGIEPDYLKLIRLGSNVTSMIDLSETERKTFMSKLLDEIGIYLTYYKKVNTDLRQVKEMISHTVDKIHRLGIDDKKDTKDMIDILKQNMEDEQKRYGDLSGEISIYKHEIEDIEDPLTLKDRLSASVKKINKMNKILEQKDDLESTDAKYYEEQIRKYENKILQQETEISANNIVIQNHLTLLNNLSEQLRGLKIQYQKEENINKDYEKLAEEHRKISVNIGFAEDNIGDYSPDYSLNDIEKFIVYIKNTQQVLDKTYEFGQKIIRKIVSLLRENKNVMNYVNSHIMNIDDNDDTNSIFLQSLSSRFTFDEKKLNCEKDDCEAKKLWVQVHNLLQNNQVNKKEKHDISFYKDMEYAYQNIAQVLTSFADYKILIEKLPENIRNGFLLENIYTNIESLKPIYDEKEINNLLSMITEYSDYNELIFKREKIEDEMKLFKSHSNIGYLSQQIENIENQISEYDDKVSDLKANISDINENMIANKNTVEYLYELKETFEKYEEISDEVHTLSSDYDKYITNKKKISELDIEISKCKFNIDNLNEKIQKYLNDLNQYKSLKKELDNFNSKYDEMSLIKEALSSNKGMSLYYIKNYLGNTEEITNELLDIAYDGQIYIDDFCITPSEFTIPFYNRGKRIRDVKYASQGELSFLSIALSFGLASQALSNYNIMLLDEIDGPLDSNNREKFIRILENQIERIGSEQNFLITHNDMFSSYPVDIIDLGFNESDVTQYKLANFIKVKLS